MIDFSSFYPNIMCSSECPIFSDKIKLKIQRLINKRIELKEKKDKVSDSLKVFLNSLYGGLNIPSRGGFQGLARIVTVLAKKQIIRLIKVVSSLDGEIIDVNTDGVIVKFPSDSCIKKYKEIIKAEFDISLTFEKIDKLFYKGVGNYLYLSGENTTTKGSWLSTNSVVKLDNEGVSSFNILNLAELLNCWVLNKSLPLLKIYRMDYTIDGREISIVNSLPYKLIKSPETSIIARKIVDFTQKPLSEIELRDFVLLGKLASCGLYNIDLASPPTVITI